MTVPSLAQVFGEHASQDANTLTISKADLAVTGLTASATNTADSLVVALILLWQSYLTTTNQNNNPDQYITIEDSFSSIISRNNINYRQNSKTINLQKVDTDSAINPNDY